MFFGIFPPDKVLPVDPDGRKLALGDEPVEVGPRHADEFGCGADANVIVRVDAFCHAASVADRILEANDVSFLVWCDSTLARNRSRFRTELPCLQK